MVSFSQAQQHASDITVRFVRKQQRHVSELLIWAVTGAGKTETIFAAIGEILQQGKSVMIATPRKDVVLELTPRLQAAFPSQHVISLHGESMQKGEIGNFVIATTHQAINYYHQFDLVVLDEVDAFPYHNSAMLQYAVQQARKPSGQLIYLTATPPPSLLQRTKQGKAELVMIPARHHGYPLIEPKIKIESQLHKWLHQPSLPRAIMEFIEHVLTNGRQAMLFVPKIEWIESLVERITTLFADKTVESNKSESVQFSWVEGTFASDPKRKEKVIAFRNGEIRLLVTTTILERGVTVASTDCLVFRADTAIFDESALVQMAGRVGRSTNDPTGIVVFVGEARSDAMNKAVRQIKHFNRLARKNGYLYAIHDQPQKQTLLAKLKSIFQKMEV